MKLPLSFYQRDDVVQIARELLGKALFTKVQGLLTGGMIVETEAYKGPLDRGSHAYQNKLTERNKIMYEAGGCSYVYICYGIHHLYNVVTGEKGSSHAILIRAIEPIQGIDIMLKRRSLKQLKPALSNGPGALSQALGINKHEHNGLSCSGDMVWIEDISFDIPASSIISSPRVGMNFDGEYKTIPWRFRIKENKFAGKDI